MSTLVYTKLMEARLTLQNMTLTKSGHNKFAGYKYFELGDFIPAIQKIFANLGLCGVISYTQDMATLTIMDMEDNSKIEITSPMSTAALKGCHEVQNLGAVQTYIRRYLWVTAMEIVEHDAIDSSPGADVEVAVKAIQSATDLDSLKAHFSSAVKLFKGDTEAFAKVNAAKDARKAELLAKDAE
jgi:hypothetical protein